MNRLRVAALLSVVPFAAQAGPKRHRVEDTPGPAFYDKLEEDGFPVMVPQRPLAAAFGARLSPDGRLVAVPVKGGLALQSAEGRLLRSYRGDGNDVSFSPDGKAIAWSGRVLLLDGSRERNFGTPLKHGPTAWLADGRLLFAEGPEIKLLDAAPSMGEKKLLALESRVTRVVVAPDGSFAAAICVSRKVTVFKLDGSLLKEWEAGDPEGRASFHSDLALQPGGRLIAIAANDGTALLYTPEGKLEKKLVPAEFGSPEPASHVVFEGATRLYTCGATLRRWDLATGEAEVVPGGASCVEVAPAGRKLLFHRDRIEVRAADGELVGKSEFLAEDRPLSLAFSPDGKTLAVGGFAGSVDFFDRTGSLRRHEPAVPSVVDEDLKSFDAVVALVYSPDGKLIATACHAGQQGEFSRQKPPKTVIVRDAATGAVLQHLGAQRNGVEALAFSADSKVLASGGGDGSIALWDASSGKLLRKFDAAVGTKVVLGSKQRDEQAITGLAFLADGRLLAGSAHGLAQLWKADGTLQWQVKVGADLSQYTSLKVALSLDGTRAAFVGRKGSQLLSVADHAVVSALPDGIAVAFSADGAQGAVGGEGLSLFGKDGAFAKGLLASVSPAWASVAFAPDGKLLAVTCADGAVRFFNLESGDAAALLTARGEWILFTGDGYFDASKNGGALVAMVKGLTPFGVDQFALRNNRPDEVLGRLGAAPDVIEGFHAQWKKRLRRAGLTEEQVAKNLAVPRATVATTRADPDSVWLDIALDGRGQKLKSYSVFINDVPIFGAAGKPLGAPSAQLRERVSLTPGVNKIEVSATDAGGAESYRALAYATRDATPKGRLFFLGFGVSAYKDPALRLKYAHKDVQDLASALSGLAPRHFAEVKVKALVDAEVTPQAIAGAKSFLTAATADDTLVVFIAGHGVHDHDKDATYYFLTHGADLADLPHTAARFEDLEALLQDVAPRKKLFLMDTCESGELDEPAETRLVADASAQGIISRGVKIKRTQGAPGARREWLMDRSRFIFADLQRRSGAVVFSSSRGGELSYERDDLKNGVFTHALLRGFAGAADQDKDGVVSVDELREYVAAEVKKATAGLQNPTVDRDNLYQKFAF